MKRDTDPAPGAIRAIRAIPPPEDGGRPSRAEIEAALDGIVPGVLAKYHGAAAVPGWQFRWTQPATFRRIETTSIPTLTEEQAARLVNLAETNADAFDAAAYVAGLNVAADAMLHHGIDDLRGTFPPSLRAFAARVLMGEAKPPPRPGRKKARDNVPLRLWQYGLCRFTAHAAGIPLGRNRVTDNAFNACQAVADAFSRAGKYTTYAQLASLCHDAKLSDLRALAEVMGLLDFLDPPATWTEGGD